MAAQKKSNPEAELVILKYLYAHYDQTYIDLISPDWFYDDIYRYMFIVLKESGRKITKLELQLRQDDFVPGEYILPIIEEIYRENNIAEQDLITCIDVIEEKYRLRMIEGKLADIQQRIYQSKSVENIQLELISYFSENISKPDKMKSLVEDFDEANNDLIEFGGARPALNDIIPIRQSIITIGGDSAHHKTNQLTDILLKGLLFNSKKNPNFKVMMFSSEMSWKRIRDRIFAKLLHIPLTTITKRKEINVKEITKRFEEEYPEVVSNFLLVSPSQFKTASDLSKFVIKHKPDIWGLDFLQYFAQMSAGNNAEMQNKNVMETIATMKVLVENTNSLGIIISQVRKKSEQRLVQFPRVDDLEWSGLTKQISNSIGMCFWPYRLRQDEAEKNWYTVSWQKVRDNEPFNEVLWVEPEFCDFKPWPTPNINLKYFNW